MSPPPSGVKARAPAATGSRAAAAEVLAWYATFQNGNGAIAYLEELKPKLSFEAKPKILEQALAGVAQVFGAHGSRPERDHGRGPDDLWTWPEFSLVIEAKNDRGCLPKADAGQMQVSMEWFRSNYPERQGVPVVVGSVTRAEHDAFFPPGTRVLTPDGLQALIASLTRFVAALAVHPPLFWREQAVADLLVQHGLSAGQFCGTYTVPVTR